MDHNQDNTGRLKILPICGLLLLSAISAFWMLGAKSLDNHECFVSITAREMLESRDWIVPRCNGEPRLNKTPLSYWLVASLAKITGQVDEFTARFPSAVFAILSVIAILYFVSKWLSLRTAVLSASVWATSLGYIRYSHNARPDMVLAFFITLSFLSFYSAVTAKERKSQVLYMMVFWISFGLANLAKGPAPLPLVLIPLFFYVVIFHHWKIIPRLLPIIGAFIFLAIVLPWPLAVAQRLNWDLALWKREFVDRFLGQYAQGDYPVYYYLLIMFKFVAPWVAFLPMALAAPFYRVWDKKQPVMKFLWLWSVVGLAFLTISAGKRQHYIVPLMPAMAILIGILIEDMAFVQKGFTAKQATKTLRSHIVVLIVLAITGPIALIIVGAVKETPLREAKTNYQLFTDAVFLSIIILILTATVTLLFIKKRPAFGYATVFIGIVILTMISYVRLVIPLDVNRHSRDFSTKVGQLVPPDEKLIAYKWVSSRSVHYVGRVIPVVEDKSALYQFYEHRGWVLATREYLEELQQAGHLRTVYYKEKAELRSQKDVPGALLHKSAPEVANDSQM